jgi:hypothetical protein
MKTSNILLSISFLLILTVGCKKEDINILPSKDTVYVYDFNNINIDTETPDTIYISNTVYVHNKIDSLSDVEKFVVMVKDDQPNFYSSKIDSAQKDINSLFIKNTLYTSYGLIKSYEAMENNIEYKYKYTYDTINYIVYEDKLNTGNLQIIRTIHSYDISYYNNYGLIY